MLEPGCPDLSFQAQTELLGINRTSLYYQPIGPSALEIATKRRIDEIYTAHPYYGSRRITVILQKELAISRPTVQRHTLAPAVQAQACVKWGSPASARGPI